MHAEIAIQIQQLEAELHAATLNNDVEATDRLLANDWLNINATGTITTKAQSLAIMTQFEFESIVNEGVEIRLYPGTAVVTGRSTRTLRGQDGGVMSSHVLFTRVYAKLVGEWQVVTSQATAIAE